MFCRSSVVVAADVPLNGISSIMQQPTLLLQLLRELLLLSRQAQGVAAVAASFSCRSVVTVPALGQF